MGVIERFSESFFPPLVGFRLSVFLHFANISLKDRYVYMATPKVACSSLIQTFQRIELRDPDFLHDPPSEIHDRRFSPLATPLQVPHFQDFVKDSATRTFCFVRNPFSRLLSCYLEKVETGPLKHRMLAALGRTDGPVTFAEFVDVIAKEPAEDMDPHYAPQCLITLQDHMSYDLVGRFETLESDISKVGDLLSLDLRPYIARIDPHRTGKKDYGFFSDRLAEVVRRVYAADFDRFGYAYDLPA